MAEIRRQPFQTVKVDIEEMDRKIREHRIRMLKRTGRTVQRIPIWSFRAIF